jgi:hypothetical protein
VSPLFHYHFFFQVAPSHNLTEPRFSTVQAILFLFHPITMPAAVNHFKLNELSPGFGAEICDFNAADNLTEETFRRLQDAITTVWN